MSYDSPIRPITITANSFASTDHTILLKPRAGAKFGFVDALVNPTTTFAGATTTPKLQVGKPGALTQICNWDMGTAAAGTPLRASIDSPASLTLPAAGMTAWLAQDEQLAITLKAATGGGAAGVADIVIYVREDVPN